MYQGVVRGIAANEFDETWWVVGYGKRPDLVAELWRKESEALEGLRFFRYHFRRSSRIDRTISNLMCMKGIMSSSLGMVVAC